MPSAAMWISLSIIATVSVIFIRITNYIAKLILNETSNETGKVTPTQSKDTPQSQGLVAGDVFAEPFCPTLLCAVLGNGVQNILITLPLAAAIIPSTMGFKLPNYTSMANEVTAILYLFLGVVAGYVGVLLRKIMKSNDDAATSRGWVKVPWLTALLSFVTFFSIRSILTYDVISISAADTHLMSLWLCISTLISLSGGCFGAQAKPTDLPVLTCKATKAVRIEDYLSWVLVLVAEFLASMIGAFGIWYMFIITWRDSSLIFSGVLLAMLALLTASASYAWLVLIRMLFYSEKLRCWWKAFFALGGPTGCYVFLGGATLSLCSLNNSSMTSFAPQLVTSLIMGLITMVSYGTVSLLLIWVRHPPVFEAAGQV